MNLLISKYVIYSLLISFYHIHIYSQIKIDSLEFNKNLTSTNSLTTIFEKKLNSYSLISGVQFSKTMNKYYLNLSEKYKSSFIKGIENTVRDENYFELFLGNQINKKIDMGLKLSNSILSDSRRIEINQSSISSLLFFSTIKVLENNMIFYPNVGLINNKQIEENDYGPEYGIEFIADKINFSNIEMSADIKIKNEDISPRKNYYRLINFHLLTNIDKNISNNFNFRFSKNRKDFYFSTDSLTSQYFKIKKNIQNRTETHYFISNKFIFKELNAKLNFESEGKISYRKINKRINYKLFEEPSHINFDTEVEEIKIGLDAVLSYRSKKINGEIKLVLSEREEKNKVLDLEGINPIFYEQKKELEEKKNNNSLNGSLIIAGEYFISEKDKIILNFYQSKLKFDTPSLLNDDDRDEILSLAKLEYNKIINPFFSIFVNAEGGQSHLVYIFASRSSNNNINRIIRLRTGSKFETSKIKSTNIFEVSANYVTYDFEDLNSNMKSFSYRQFSALDSTKIFLSNIINLNFQAYIKLAEQGDFSWRYFSEKPKRFLKEILIEPKITYSLEYYSFTFGLRYFNFSTYNYQIKKRIFDNSFISYGPLSSISINFSEKVNINFSGYFELIELSNSTKRQQSNLNINIYWNF